MGRQWFLFPILSDKFHVLTARLYNPLYFYLDFPSQSVGDVFESISPSGSDKQRKAFSDNIRQYIRLYNVFSIFQVRNKIFFGFIFLIIPSVRFFVAIRRWKVPSALLPMERSLSFTKSFHSVQLMLGHGLF